MFLRGAGLWARPRLTLLTAWGPANLPALRFPLHCCQIIIGVVVVVPAQATEGSLVGCRHMQAHKTVPIKCQRDSRGSGNHYI